MFDFRSVVLSLLFIGYSLFLQAQDPVNTADLKPRPTAVAVALESGPAIDGDVLGDEIWKAMDPLGDLSQAQPNFGQAPTEKTEIRVAYTAEVLKLNGSCNIS